MSIKKTLAVLATITLATLSFAAPAQAATKKITCYKGTQTKVVTTAKCPAGWSTKKPAATPSKAAPSKAAATATTTAFNATYTGKLALLWSDSGVTASSVTATSTGATNAGLADLSGKGSSSPQSKCDIILGDGTLSGGGNTLKVEFDSTTKGCAEDESGPTDVTLTGTAVIKGGTGKFAGATGTLKATGKFRISSTTAGTSEKVTLTLTISGNIVTK